MLSPQRAIYNKQVEKFETIRPLKNRIIRYFPDIHLGNEHRGLAEIAKAKGVDVLKLDPGEFVIFVNRAQTGLKLFAPGYIVAYLKMPGTTRINPDVISKIPRFFNGTEIQYDKALRETIRKQFGKYED